MDDARKNFEAPGASQKVGVLLPLYALALFASAFLAFWIQPLFAKILLPRYGGSPAVWTTATLFFQVMLLAGYFYAHVLARLPLKHQLAMHVLVMAVAGAALPVQVAAIDPASPVLSLLAVLVLSLGMPFFALSATAPLLQRWFSQTAHPHARDPYFLYSASNAGSLLALIGYPLALEQLLGLKQQTLAWSLACAVFAALLMLCGAGAWREHVAAPKTPGARAASPLTWRVRGRWLLLAFAPSSLMLGVTQHITSEIAAVPLLWLVPLTIYVLTFVIAFSRATALARAADRVQPLLVVLLALAWPLNNRTSVLGLDLVVFGVTALMCHAELARTRPAVQHLTSFYLWLAVGGAAGGAFNALVAPVIFNTVLEYPLALGLACALRPPGFSRVRWTDFLPAAALAAAFALLVYSGVRPFAHAWWAVVLYLQVVGVTLYLTHRRPLQFALALLVVLIATPVVHSGEKLLERDRSFFGVHSVLRDETNTFNVLMHGITIHGAQFVDPAKRTQPTTYYHADSPIGQILSVLGRNGGLRRVAVIGMGTGTLACHRAPGREWTFYEIDPVVVRIAQDPRYFHFLSDCAPAARIVVGDGRLMLAREPVGASDLIVIDTFSSDSVPAHMMTREAVALYLRHVGAQGIVAFHITNEHLNLVPVLARLAVDAHVAAFMPGPRLDIQLDERLAALPSSWIAFTRDPSRLAPLIAEENWVPLPAPAPGRVWTDDYSNVLGALK